MKFTQLAQSLKEKLEPVYLIEGEEAYFRDHAVRAIREEAGITQPPLLAPRASRAAARSEAYREDHILKCSPR